MESVKGKKHQMNCTAPGRFNILFAVLSAPVFTICCVLSSSCVNAEVRVLGSTSILNVEAKNASFGEIVNAINTTLSLHISFSPALNQIITGTYTGPLQRIFSRMLDDRNYMIKTSGNQMEIVLLGADRASLHSAKNFERSKMPVSQLSVKTDSALADEDNSSSDGTHWGAGSTVQYGQQSPGTPKSE